MKTFNKYLNEQLKNPEFMEEYNNIKYEIKNDLDLGKEGTVNILENTIQYYHHLLTT